MGQLICNRDVYKRQDLDGAVSGCGVEIVAADTVCEIGAVAASADCGTETVAVSSICVSGEGSVRVIPCLLYTSQLLQIFLLLSLHWLHSNVSEELPIC